MDTITNTLCAIIRGDPVDWPDNCSNGAYDLLLEEAAFHGVDSLLCHALKSTGGWGGLPTQFRDELMRRYRLAAAADIARQDDLNVLLERLKGEDVPVLLLKGGALAHTHYPEPYLRSRCDTDLFIGPGDIGKVSNVFREAGYQVSGLAYKSHQFNCYKTDFGGAANYDVHWRVNNHAEYARIIDHEAAMADAVVVSGLDNALTLSPVRALLLACMHRAASDIHDPDRLIWVYDIHLLVTDMSDVEIREFARLAAEKNIQQQCLAAIEKSRSCFSTDIPEEVSVILSVAPGKLTFSQQFAASQLGLIVDDLKVLPGIRARLELLREYIFPPADYLLNRYGKKSGAWLPAVYLRYLFVGLFERFSLR